MSFDAAIRLLKKHRAETDEILAALEGIAPGEPEAPAAASEAVADPAQEPLPLEAGASEPANPTPSA